MAAGAIDILDSSLKFKSILKKLSGFLIYRYYSLRLILRRKPYKIILILSHSRSGSTLLQHLLFSNDAIAGFGENHISYESEDSIKQLIFNTYWHLRKIKMKEKYVVDKIVQHSSLSIHKDILLSPEVYKIFLIREPQGSILSLLQGEKNREKGATESYIKVLSVLEGYAEMMSRKEQSLFLTYEQILNRTESVLSKLQDFLNLQQPLSEKYEILRTTGWASIGDWSENIKTGKIVRKRKRSDIEISKESLDKASDAFNHCRSVLSQYCTVI